MSAPAAHTCPWVGRLLSCRCAWQFYTDLLSEQLQDELEQQDQHSLLHFAWLMHKKTLIGVQRFEDLIHAKFEELVLLGFLRPRWQPHK